MQITTSLRYFTKELAGERRFMYEIFHVFLKQRTTTKPRNLKIGIFSISISKLKSKLRDNIIQNNNVVGLANFDHEKHKMIFIDGYPAYKNILVKYAIVGMLNSDPENRYIESRITPKESVIELDQKIKSIAIYWESFITVVQMKRIINILQ